MNIGMLWFDNDPKIALSGKIDRAATYYRSKYGSNPTLCFVHPSMLAANSTDHRPGDSLKTNGIEIRASRSVLPNHFWIGINGSAS